MACGFRKEVIMRKQTRHRFVATNYNHYKCLLPFLLYNSYCTKFAQQRKSNFLNLPDIFESDFWSQFSFIRFRKPPYNVPDAK